jgi:Uma2 family endonuclease
MEPFESQTLLTADDYSRTPDDGLRHALQAGLLIAEPQPFPRHAQIQARLTRVLAEFVDSRGLGVVLTEGGFLLSRNPDTVRAPDVSFVRAARFDVEEAERGYFRGAPDLAIEILSPSNRPGDTHAKVADYLASGATLVWVIDPVHQLADVYRSLLSPRRVAGDGVLEGEDVLPEFSVPIAEILKR